MSSSEHSPRRRRSVSRRDFLRVGGMSVVGLSVAQQAALAQLRKSSGNRGCILLLMNGGPSPFETFDPKPEAPAEIRGPFRPIATNVPGIQLSELLGQLARRADRFSLVRSVFHDAAPIHETGLQLLQTGRLARRGVRFPAIGSAAAHVLGPRGDLPAYAVLPKLLDDTGVNAYRGQTAGFLGDEFDPATSLWESTADANGDGIEAVADLPTLEAEPESIRRAYGDHCIGRLCLRARQLVEAGVRCVTVNLCGDPSDGPTFDCHGRVEGSGGTIYDYRDTLCPAFDRAVSTLLDDLGQRGLFDETLVIATGEFGRTPQINAAGGRDHWPHGWSALLAGGGLRGGQVVGATDAHGVAVTDRPVHVAELTATVYRCLEIPTETPVRPDVETAVSLCEASPVAELFG